jgi:hypothetical protein
VVQATVVDYSAMFSSVQAELLGALPHLVTGAVVIFAVLACIRYGMWAFANEAVSPIRGAAAGGGSYGGAWSGGDSYDPNDTDGQWSPFWDEDSGEMKYDTPH